MSAVIQNGDLSTPPDPSGYIDDFGVLPKAEAKQLSLVVLNDFITAGGSATTLSNSLLNGLIGAFDQMAIEVVTDRLNSPDEVGLQVQIEHSGDGRAWVAKAVAPEIPLAAINAGQSTTFPIGFDDGSIPSLAFVRLRFDFYATAIFIVRVKCTVTLNNTHERAFTQEVTNKITGGDCASWMEPGTAVSIDGDGHWSDPRIAAIMDMLPGPVHRAHFAQPLRAYFDPPEPSCENPDGCYPENVALTLGPMYRICFSAALHAAPGTSRPVPSLSVLRRQDTGYIPVFSSDWYWEPLDI